MSAQWRASREWLGDRPPRWEAAGLTWEQARCELRAELIAFGADQECEHCIGQAGAALAKLDRLAGPAPFREMVDGTDYVLAPMEAA